ncbi:hypothetical protein OJAV_G00208490 [Oryzias javanicus]|uniref:Uncharacterized protein n=1 Tax=Oryzias javanicus TaxID=123683 RepID=A0A3S2TYA1_ORYJA|nr:hypothetical protein OJAV_G00208490 [Oryzias javanicus]
MDTLRHTLFPPPAPFPAADWPRGGSRDRDCVVLVFSSVRFGSLSIHISERWIRIQVASRADRPPQRWMTSSSPP